MTFEITGLGVTRKVSVRSGIGCWLVQVDGGPERQFSGHACGVAEWLLRENEGGVSAIGVHVGRAATWVQVDGYGMALEVRDARSWTGAGGGAQPKGHVITPMPGVVTRVPVAVGDQVIAGSVVVVVEAMKMENELRSAISGIVTAVRATLGAPVEGGAVLVVVETQ